MPGGAASVGVGGDVPETLDAMQAFIVTDEAGEAVGSGGRVADGVVDAPVWAGDVWALELILPHEPAPAVVPTHVPLPQFPASERDLALLVPESVPAKDVSEVIRAQAGDALEALELFDEYRGEGVADGCRSLAFRLRFRSPKRTLKDKEVDRYVHGILKRLEEALGVQARA